MIRLLLTLYFLFGLSAFSYADVMIIKLPAPKEKGNVSLEEAIKKRRSERSLQGQKLTLEEIGQLLWSCQGITDEDSGHRSAPSAGATYPLEIFLVSSDGFFQYIPKTHSIKIIKKDDLRPALSKACLGQGFVKDAAVDILICADFKRTTDRYGDRGMGYVYIEVGHAAQNVHLQAVAMDLGSVPVGAFSGDSVKALLGLSQDLVPIYVIPVGYIKD